MSVIAWDVDQLMPGSREECSDFPWRVVGACGPVAACVLTVNYSPQALVTVPLALLQKGALQFNPPLSDKKMKAINSLGAGIIEKVIT